VGCPCGMVSCPCGMVCGMSVWDGVLSVWDGVWQLLARRHAIECLGGADETLRYSLLDLLQCLGGADENLRHSLLVLLASVRVRVTQLYPPARAVEL